MLPFSPPAAQKGHSPVIMNRLQSIKSTMPVVLSLVQKAVRQARRERDHLRYLEFVAHLNLWFAKKVETQEEVRRLSKSVVTETRKDSVATAIVALCTDVLKDLGSLRMEFETLWLKTNRPEGLEILLRRYDRQISFWQEKINQVKRGIFWVDPEIESAWIYHAPVDTGKTTKVRVQHAWFRKTFSAPKETRSATLQLIGDTFVKVWVNEKYVGEVYARRSNSLSAEYQRIKIFDILPFLCDSTNIIAVECRDYSLTGSAGVNIYCELQDRGGVVQKVMTDTTWKVSDKPAGGWENAGFDDSRWARPIIISYPYTIVRPDFATGRASWIEQ